MPEPRIGETITYVPTPIPHLLLFGGVTSNGEFKNDLWIFNILQLKWEKINPKGDIPCPRELHSAVLWKKHLIIFGGLTYNNSINEKNQDLKNKKIEVLNDMYWFDLGKK